MIVLEDRQQIARDIEVARAEGARLEQACDAVGITARTLQRWTAGQGLVAGDGRPGAIRPQPAHTLTQAEREQIMRKAPAIPS